MREMKEVHRSLNLLFFVILILGFVSGFIFGFRHLLPFVLDWQTPASSLATIFFFFSVISFIISPIMVFIAIYYVGRELDLRLNLGSSIIRLLSGGYVGQLMGCSIAYLISGYGFDSIVQYLGLMLSLAISSLSIFFTAFTALALAYIRKNNQIGNEPPSPRSDLV
jgi:hypothetical protein